MLRAAAWLLALLLVLLLLLGILPAPHPEARLFSADWGAASFVDPAQCAPAAASDGAPPGPPENGAPNGSPSGSAVASDALRAKPAPVARWGDRLTLAVRYVALGLLLPLLATLASVHPRAAPRHAGVLVWLLLGAAPAYFHWPLNPLFVGLRQHLAVALVERGLATDLWLQTADALALLLWLAAGVALAGGLTQLATRSAARLAGLDPRLLTQALVPLAAATVLLGTTLESARYLRGEGVALQPGLDLLRAALLLAAVAVALVQGLRAIAGPAATPGRPRAPAAVRTARRRLAGLVWLLVPAMAAVHNGLLCFHWTGHFHV